MRKEYAILRGKIKDVLDGDYEVVFKNQYPEYILAELVMLEDDDYTVEECIVADDGEFIDYDEAKTLKPNYDTVENFKKRFGTWYAICADDDNDWSVGSYDKNKALDMLRKMPASYQICVIEIGTDPTCVDIICND